MPKSPDTATQTTAETQTPEITTEPQKDPKDMSVQELKDAGFVLEVTAKDPDIRNKQGQLIEKGKIFDLYHHACSKEDCMHKDKSTAGRWQQVPAEDESRCVNPW